jgi:integrase
LQQFHLVKELSMTPVRQRMTEDMQVRNLSPHTQASYVQQVSLFARYFNKSPEVLGPEEIRAYQVYLTNERKLAASSILIAVSALRFLYKVTLHKKWAFEDMIPPPKKPQTLPVVLSPEEVLQFLDCISGLKHRTILTTCYAAGLRISEAVRLKPADIDSSRMVIRVEQGKGQKDRYVMLSSKLLQRRRRTGMPEGASAVPHSQTDHAAFSSPRLRRPSAGVRHRRANHPTVAGSSQPGDHRAVFADRHYQGVLYHQSPRLAPAASHR